MASVMPSAASRMVVALTSRSTSGTFRLWPPEARREARFICGSSPVLTGLADGAPQPLDLAVRDVDVGHAEERRDRLLWRAGEVRLDDVREHVLARDLGGLRGIVDVARPVFLEADQLLLAEDAQHGAHGGVGRGSGRSPMISATVASPRL